MIAGGLSSNGIQVPSDVDHFGFLTETPLADIASGSARLILEDQGYILLRQILNPDDVLDLREAYFQKFDRNFLADGDARRGIYSGIALEGEAAYGTVKHPAHDIVRSSLFQKFVDQPALATLAAQLLGGPAVRVPRTPFRHFIRTRSTASRAHYDRTYLNCPVEDCITFWIPLGDCPVEAGSLVYLEGSHRDETMELRLKEIAPTDRANDSRPLTHDLGWLSEKTGRRWLTANFKAGDLVAHRSDIVHASLDSKADLMRLSTDVRFVRTGVALDPRWLNDWSADDGY